jgi:hypothetical protein
MALILLTNPLLYLLSKSLRWYPPDSVGYVVFGRDFFADGLLFLRSWVHVDTGLILPPALPFLIALFESSNGDLFTIAERISSVSLLLAGIPLYLLARQTAGRVGAASAVIVAQLGYATCFMGLAPLSEALFILIVACALLLLRRFLDSDWALLGLVTGAACCAVFLTRQVGLFLLAFAVLWSLLASFLAEGRRFQPGVLAKPGLIACGFLIVFGPYAAVVFHQSGSHPLQQYFRMGIYEVSTNDAAALAEIERIETQAATDSGEIYAKRRQLRRLLPDGSEMFSYVLRPEAAEADQGPLALAAGRLAQPGLLAENLARNLGFLRDALGAFLTGLFIATAITPFVLKRAGPPFASRYFLAGFVLFNLFGVSLVSGTVARYVEVFLPFALLHVASELSSLGREVFPSRRWRTVAAAFPALVLLVGAALMPRHFDQIKLHPKPPGSAETCPGFPVGSAVFSRIPLDAYRVGGRFRALPNDRLSKIVIYAHKTEVDWLVVDGATTAPMYTHAKWYGEPDLHRSFANLVDLQCTVKDGRYRLYRIKPATEGSL